MTNNDMEWLEATAQATLLRNKEVPADTFVRKSISAISGQDELINAVVSIRFEKALSEVSDVPADAPFAGVPVLVKDLGCGVAGEPLWNGNRVLRREDYRAVHDGPMTKALRSAGFVVVGRTNTAEFGATITTEPLATGPCANPWDLTLSSGGSSGGSAAAVAAGYVPIAHGTDASGSVRIPASVCGVVGLKPSLGSLPLDDSDGDAWFGLATPGLFARSVSDVQTAFSVLSGTAGVQPGTALPSTLSIAMVLPEAESDTTALMETTAATLRALGHRVDVRTPSFLMDEHWRRNFLTLVGAGTAAEIAYWERELGSVIYPYGLDPSTAQIADIGRKATGSDIAKSYQGLRDYRELAAQWWASEEGADLILTPVLEHPQAPLGWLNDPLEGGRRIRKTMLYTPQFNMSGDPAIALPLGQTPGGLPIGLQLAAARGREDLLFRVGLELEQQMPWSHRTPHLS